MSDRTLLVLCLMAVLLVGCPREWSLMVTDLSDPRYPGFCISRYAGCEGPGTTFSQFIVAEVDDAGRYAIEGKLIKPMWIIEPTRNVALREFRYGTTPEGWRQVQPAIPLELGRFYSAEGYYFRFVRSGERTIAEVLPAHEFLSKYRR